MFVCLSPEGVPRLFDLIRVKDKSFLPVFYFALRDTLVANDLEQATRIAYGRTRHRVVTLAGQLIETSGNYYTYYYRYDYCHYYCYYYKDCLQKVVASSYHIRRVIALAGQIIEISGNYYTYCSTTAVAATVTTTTTTATRIFY